MDKNNINFNLMHMRDTADDGWWAEMCWVPSMNV
jgi:hypothetical protein